MNPILSSVLAAAALAALGSGPVQASLTTEPFGVRTTASYVDLCTSDPADPLHDDAINFCHGYTSGAWQYHQAQASGPEGRRLVCLPEPTPKRADAIAMFVTWARAHPEHMNEPAVESLFRFLTEKWPCAESAATEKGAAK